MSGNGILSGSGRVSGNGWVFDNGWVSGNGRVFGNGILSGNGRIAKDMKLTSKALVIDGLSQHCITVADAGMVSIGCEVHHIDTWLIDAGAIGSNYYYSNKDVAEYLSTLKYIKFMINNYRRQV